MATQVARRLFTVEEYHRMGEVGILGEDDRVELVEGEIVQMSPIGSRHAACVKRLARLFHRRVGEQAVVGVQDPVRLSQHSEPQPDVSLLKPRADFYASGHPGAEDVLLVVEVVESSGAYDRDVKIPLYARAGVPEVWVVDLAEGRVEVYRKPSAEGYREVRQLGRGERLAPEALPDLELEVEEVLV